MIKKLALTLVVSFCLALSAGLFIIPNNILSGGVAGISVAISPLISFVPKEYISSFITVEEKETAVTKGNIVITEKAVKKLEEVLV